MMKLRNCLLVTVLAATAFLGWAGKLSATPIRYFMNDAVATFRNHT